MKKSCVFHQSLIYKANLFTADTATRVFALEAWENGRGNFDHTNQCAPYPSPLFLGLYFQTSWMTVCCSFFGSKDFCKAWGWRPSSLDPFKPWVSMEQDLHWKPWKCLLESTMSMIWKNDTSNTWRNTLPIPKCIWDRTFAKWRWRILNGQLTF